MEKVNGTEHVVDLLTKHTGKDGLRKHMIAVSLGIRSGWHSRMPKCDDVGESEAVIAVDVEDNFD